MKYTTLGYIEYNDSYLMLYRSIDKNDGSHGKWLGIGGKQEKSEHIDDCFIREVREEAGINLTKDSDILTKINRIPGIEFSSKQYRKFVAEIKGNINGDDYVKSFEWIN